MPIPGDLGHIPSGAVALSELPVPLEGTVITRVDVVIRVRGNVS